MLDLLRNTEARETLKAVQKEFLVALRENNALTLEDRISVSCLENAIDAYIELLQEQIFMRLP